MISIIVPTFNSALTIKSCLEGIRSSEGSRYELIVADDGSVDKTAAIAEQYADQIVLHPKNLGRSRARKTGVRASQGDILLFVDSDVVIRPDTILKVTDYFKKNPKVDAVTGLLSKEHPNQDFFSQYKNLYMNFIFSQLPEKITFLFGSIYAVRRKSLILHDSEYELAEDSAHGQRLVKRGKEIRFMRDLEAVHLKKYDLISLIKNDFRIPFNWAGILVKYRGWKRLFRGGTGYLHSPKGQLASVLIVFTMALLWILFSIVNLKTPILGLLFLLWVVVNARFFIFFYRAKRFSFTLISIVWTFLDQMIMVSGILCGFIYAARKELKGKKRLGKKVVQTSVRS